MDNIPNNEQNLEPQIKMAPVFSLSLFYNMYKIFIGEESYMAKVFPIDKVNNYQKEKQILTQLQHPYIIKPIDFNHVLVHNLNNSLKAPLILFPHYKTDLLQFIQTNGSLSQQVTKFFIKQILQALLYAYSQGILHHNLIAQNILLNQNKSILLCGWSNSLANHHHTLQNLLFQIGQLIISLCTSRKPFISRDPRNDTFAKFLNDKYIHKFWEQIQKVAKRNQKNIEFSKQLKQLVSELFLKKVNSLQKIQQYGWFKESIKQKEVYDELQKQESNAQIAKQIRKNKIVALQLQQKQLAKNKFSINNIHRKPSRSYDIFQEEYQNCEQTSASILQKSKSDCQAYFKLYDKDLRLMISHLRARLRQVQRDEIDIIDPLLILKDPEVTYSQSQIKINCNFGWNYNLILQNNLLSGFDYSATIIVRHEQQQILGRLEMKQKSQLNAECIFRMNKWLVQSLQHYG